MSRIATYASSKLMNNYLRTVQTRINDSTTKIATQTLSQDYTGIGSNTKRLLSYEVDISSMESFVTGNQNEDTYIKIADSTVSGIEKTFQEMLNKLQKFNAANITDKNTISALQKFAFVQMTNLEADLNTTLNGSHIFAGNRTDHQAVDFNLTNLTDFQAKYDGMSVNYPTTTAKHTENFDLSKDSAGKTNWLTFTQDTDGLTTTAGTSNITATTAQFANVTVGTVIDVTGTASNNGSYEVTAVTNGGLTVEVKTVMLTNEGPLGGAATITKDEKGATALAAANFGTLTFNRNAGTMTAATANSLSSLTVGSSFTVAGSTQNNGSYVVVSNTGSVVKVKEVKLTDEGTAATPTLNYGPNNITFTNNVAANDRITAVAGAFSAVKPGMQVTMAGSAVPANNATFTVVNVATDGSYFDVLETLTTDAATGNETAVITQADGTVKSSTYYKGDLLTRKHRVSKNLDYTINMNAQDPAFERGIRALGIIAQGKYGTAGGLEQPGNAQRMTDAINLLKLSIDSNDVANPQYEAAYTNNMRNLSTELSNQRVMINKANASQNTLIKHFGDRVKAFEEADKLTYISLLTNDENALKASYSAVSLINGLNLSDYLR